MEKTILKHDGILTLDGCEWFKMPLADVLQLPAAEATGKNVLLADFRRPVVLSNGEDENGNPIQLLVTLKVEVAPRNARERQMVENKRASSAKAASEREAKADRTQDRVFHAITQTAIAAVKGNEDPIAKAVKDSVAANIAAALGQRPALGSGQ